MILFKLFLSFAQIGFTSFGGLSMVPLISSEMVGHDWMSNAEVLDIVAIAEMTPGPLGLNCSTFAGIRVAGIAGAIWTMVGVLLPAFTLCLIAAVFFEKFKENKIMQWALYGIRPVCMGLIGATVIKLCAGNYIDQGILSWPSIAIGCVMALLIGKWKLSVPKVILLSAVLGLILVR